MGDLWREVAKEKGISFLKLHELNEKTNEYDLLVDEKLKKIGKEKDNLIVVGRLAYHFIPDSFKVFLDVQPAIGAERINQCARPEERFKGIKDGIRKVKERIASDKKRYKKLYGIDYLDKKNYDLWIDTGAISAEEVAEKILEAFCKVKNLPE